MTNSPDDELQLRQACQACDGQGYKRCPDPVCVEGRLPDGQGCPECDGGKIACVICCETGWVE